MDKKPDWHGWSKGETAPALHIGKLPGRKSICLYEHNGKEIKILAFFKSEERAERALKLMDWLLFRTITIQSGNNSTNTTGYHWVGKSYPPKGIQ